MKKKPWLAFALNFLIPGAGLVYLGEWKSGILNLVVVSAILLVLMLLPLPLGLAEHFHYVVLGLAAASGGLAHAVAERKSV